MKRKYMLLLIMGGILSLLLSACGASASPSPEALSAVLAPTDDEAYAEYAGYQFSGKDPWDGTLTLTIKGIYDGKMEWTLTDSFEDYTLYQTQKDTVLQNGMADFDLQGKDVEGKDISFALQGSLELKEEKITVTFLSGSVTDASSQVEKALSEDGLSHQTVLDRANGPYVRYIVQEGDSLHSIAKAFGISTKDLAILNQIVIEETARTNGLEFDDVTEYAKYLFPGEELLLPLKNN